MTDKRSAEIDRLTREHIASEMKVPAAMVSTTTDLYKKVYDEMSAKVPDDFDPDKSAPTIDSQNADNSSESKKRTNNKTFGGNLGNATMDDSIWKLKEHKAPPTRPVNHTRAHRNRHRSRRSHNHPVMRDPQGLHRVPQQR